MQITRLWDTSVTYASGDSVYGSDGDIYRSRVSSNSGNDPVTSEEWEGSFGKTQTYQDVKASRAVSTVYTNSTSRMIFVIITLTDPGSGNNIEYTFEVDGVQVERGRVSPSSTATNGALAVKAIIPVASTYEIKTTETIETWFELRV